jgi:hypothetical protein
MHRNGTVKTHVNSPEQGDSATWTSGILRSRRCIVNPMTGMTGIRCGGVVAPCYHQLSTALGQARSRNRPAYTWFRFTWASALLGNRMWSAFSTSRGTSSRRVLFEPCRAVRRHRRYSQAAQACRLDGAPNHVREGEGHGRGGTEPSSSPSTVTMTVVPRVSPTDRSEARMIGYHQEVAKAKTESLGYQ